MSSLNQNSSQYESRQSVSNPIGAFDRAEVDAKSGQAGSVEHWSNARRQTSNLLSAVG
ncbi:hypothetical protein [Mesorhizobium sp. M1136]|uniref:hypothetical protein n=1 Tax=Mesorhizobium sp. M1136 TaxID=2957059 RepID=UPI0033378011